MREPPTGSTWFVYIQSSKRFNIIKLLIVIGCFPNAEKKTNKKTANYAKGK